MMTPIEVSKHVAKMNNQKPTLFDIHLSYFQNGFEKQNIPSS